MYVCMYVCKYSYVYVVMPPARLLAFILARKAIGNNHNGVVGFHNLLVLIQATIVVVIVSSFVSHRQHNYGTAVLYTTMLVSGAEVEDRPGGWYSCAISGLE